MNKQANSFARSLKEESEEKEILEREGVSVKSMQSLIIYSNKTRE